LDDQITKVKKSCLGCWPPGERILSNTCLFDLYFFLLKLRGVFVGLCITGIISIPNNMDINNRAAMMVTNTAVTTRIPEGQRLQ